MSCDKCLGVQKMLGVKDCLKCPVVYNRPKVFAANQEVLELYEWCHGQWVYAGMGEAVALNGVFVLALLKTKGIEDDLPLFQRIMHFGSKMLESSRKYAKDIKPPPKT